MQMSVTFDVYRIGEEGRRELVCSTKSAREAREARDEQAGEMLVVGRDDAALHNRQLRSRAIDAKARKSAEDDVEGDYLI
jgi:hypothetical protein